MQIEGIKKIAKIRNDIDNFDKYKNYLMSLCTNKSKKNCVLVGNEIIDIYENISESLKEDFWIEFFNCKLYKKIEKNTRLYQEMQECNQFKEIMIYKLFDKDKYNELKIKISDNEYVKLINEYLDYKQNNNIDLLNKIVNASNQLKHKIVDEHKIKAKNKIEEIYKNPNTIKSEFKQGYAVCFKKNLDKTVQKKQDGNDCLKR